MEKSVGRLISILYRKNQVYLNFVLAQYNITASELPVIMYLYNNDGASQEEVSSYLIIDKASTARVVKSLTEKKYIRKEKDPNDHRVNRIFLNNNALEQKEKIYQALNQWSSFLMEGLEDSSLDIMYEVLESMVEKVETTNFKEKFKEESGGQDHGTVKPVR